MASDADDLIGESLMLATMYIVIKLWLMNFRKTKGDIYFS